MSESDAKTVHGEVLGFARRVLGSQALATLLLMGLAVWGYKALAAESHDAGIAAAAPVLVRVERVEAQVVELGRDQAEARRRIERTETLSVETAANLRLLLLRFGVQPVAFEQRDGGQ